MGHHLVDSAEIASRHSGPAASSLGTDLCRFRSEDEEILGQQKKFLKYFKDSSGPVLDVGCGRGTMLELLSKGGVDSYGVDAFTPALEICREKGLRVVESDFFEHLKELPECSLGGMFCSHIIEHLAPVQALTLLREAHRVLRAGSNLVLVTPNPKDLRVITETFWLDLSHVRFYPARLLKALLEEVGFRAVECLEDNETSYSKLIHRRIAGFIRRLWLWGFINRGDVIVVARR